MGQYTRDLTSTEEAELTALNEAVDQAIAKRTAWLDAKMAECCLFEPGDALYDLRTGRCVGTFSKLYRFWAGRDENVRDTSFSCDVEYKQAGTQNCYGNTSGETLSLGTREEAHDRMLSRAARLARP